MLIYDNPVNGKFDNRLLRLDLRKINCIETLKDYDIGNFLYVSTLVANERLGYVVEGNREWIIAYGKARAIDYDIKYRQNKKYFGHYLSIGRSTYFHMFGIGNTKRRDLIYVKKFSPSKYDIISTNYNMGHVVTLSTAVYNKNKNIQFRFGFSILIRKSVVQVNKQAQRYRKNDNPVICIHTRKVDCPDDRYAFAIYIHKHIKMDRISFKPMYIPMVSVKSTSQDEEEEDD